MVLIRTNFGDQVETARYIRAEKTGGLLGTNVQSDLQQLAGRNQAAAEFTIDGGGSVPATNVMGTLEIPFACTITQWTLIGDQAGSIVLDVRRCTAAVCNPPTHPGAGDTISGTDKPTLSSQSFNQDVALSGWGTTAINEGDIVGVFIVSASVLTRATLSLKLKRT